MFSSTSSSCFLQLSPLRCLSTCKCQLFKNLANMDEEARIKVRKMNRRDAAVMRAISLRITGTMVTMVMLLWTIHRGFKLAAEPGRYSTYASWAFHLGVATMLFGFLFLILGLPILADLFLNLSDQLQDETGIRQVRETRTTCKVAAHIFVTVFTMTMLLWVIYTGFRLATESSRNSKYHLLTITVGVVTIIFGLVYLIIGLAIFVELALDLLGHLPVKEKGYWH